jgi:tRNA (cytidine/uridine-2'-O-)-methyltransferase
MQMPTEKTRSPLQRHLVLVSPQVHWNTGNIGRSCLGVGARLHLIRPLGFSLDCSQVKRAGLDYWERVPLSVWDSFEIFCEALRPRPEEVALLTKRGRRLFWDIPRADRLFLILGSESLGLPSEVFDRFKESTYRIPITSEIRCLNLSSAAAIVLYESLRGRCQEIVEGYAPPSDPALEE